ncbi:hypothetical protein PV11_09477 [Exophiala sideris]|uniref:DUF1772 domain-containing protein n=1 Tax=Exophiala sideris TaxID=1016849 RepID=A0A0D1YA53_9EURO|nr:hypothetical protein PV11_09477 [Exophiala sideris]
MDRIDILKATSLVGLTSSLWLSGIYFGSSQLTVPLLFGLPVDTSAKLFKDLYYSGAKTVVPLALLGTVCTGVAGYLDPEKRVGYAIAATSTIGTLAWTRAAMMGNINRLLAIADDKKVKENVRTEEMDQLLRQWQWMNAVRAVLAGVGGVLGLLVTSRIL